MTDDLESLRIKYQNALAEIDKLRQENARLKQTATAPISTSTLKPKVKVHQLASAPSQIHSQSSVEETFPWKRRCLSQTLGIKKQQFWIFTSLQQ